jgi:hypothetical protein
MVQINDTFHEHLDTEKLDRIIDDLRARGTEGSAE